MDPGISLLPFGPLLLIGLGGLELNDDDAGTVYPRGERTRIPAARAEELRGGPLAEQFLFLGREGQP